MLDERLRPPVGISTNRPFPFAYVNVPTPDRFGLNGSHSRSDVASENSTLRYEEKAFFGYPDGFLKETPAVTPVYKVPERNGMRGGNYSRIVTMVPIAPYTVDGIMTVATDRIPPSHAELAANGGKRMETKLASDLPADAAVVYQASLNAGLQAAARFRRDAPETGYPFVMQNHFTEITNDAFDTSRSVALVHAHVGRYRSSELIDRERPDFSAVEVEQNILTLDRTMPMALAMQMALDRGLDEFGYPVKQYAKVVVLPRIEAPFGVEIRYLEITTDTLTKPKNIHLMADVSRLLFPAYVAGLESIKNKLPTKFEHEGVIFDRLPIPGFREITYIHELSGEVRTAIAPALIQSSNGAPNLAGIKGRRGSAHKITDERQAQATEFATSAGDNINETVAKLGLVT